MGRTPSIQEDHAENLQIDIVRLIQDERAELDAMTRKGKTAAQADLQQVYCVFAENAQALDPEYDPETVKSDESWVRVLELLWNFCPSSPGTVKKYAGQRCPAERLNEGETPIKSVCSALENEKTRMDKSKI